MVFRIYNSNKCNGQDSCLFYCCYWEIAILFFISAVWYIAIILINFQKYFITCTKIVVGNKKATYNRILFYIYLVPTYFTDGMEPSNTSSWSTALLRLPLPDPIGVHVVKVSVSSITLGQPALEQRLYRRFLNLVLNRLFAWKMMVLMLEVVQSKFAILYLRRNVTTLSRRKWAWSVNKKDNITRGPWA